MNVLDPSYHSFIEQVTPTLQQRKIGLLAMKTLANGRFFARKVKLDSIQWKTDTPVVPDRVSVAQAIHFAWSLPSSVLITGVENVDLIQEKIGLARAFVTPGNEERQGLIDKVSDLAAGGKIEYFKRIA